MLDARVLATDIDPSLVKSATENIARNHADIEIRGSDFFSGVADANFDFVVFNPPYVPQTAARVLKLPRERRSQWDGGEDGLHVIRKYLSELSGLDRPVTTLLGTNRWFVAATKVSSAVEEWPELQYQGTWRHPVLPADIHTIYGPARQPPD